MSKDLQSLKTAIDQIVVAPFIGPASINRIYALLHNSKVQGEAQLQSGEQYMFIGLWHSPADPHPDEGTWRAVKAHIDALTIVVDYNFPGDGGHLGQRMVEELRGLAEAAGL